MAIKTLVVPLGIVKASQVSTPRVPVPDFLYNQIQASGYVTDGSTGQVYYYNAQTEQWYYKVGSLLYPLAISWQPSPTTTMLQLVGGVDEVRFKLTFGYIGPAIEQEFIAFIGENKTSGSFASWWNSVKICNIPRNDGPNPTIITSFFIDVPVGTNKGGEDIACYLKKDQTFIEEGTDSTPYYYNVGHIGEAEGDFSDLAITSFQKV